MGGMYSIPCEICGTRHQFVDVDDDHPYTLAGVEPPPVLPAPPPPPPEPSRVTGLCGPYGCDFPPTDRYRWRERWTCPQCGTTYVRARRRPDRFWRRTYAPGGFWVLPFVDRLREMAR